MKEFSINIINKFFFFILLLCILNLTIMHISFCYSDYLESSINTKAITDNILGMIIDISFIYIVAYYITWKKQKTALTITYAITICWSFTNIIYSRFFHHYLSLSAMTQSTTLFDWEMFKCVLSGFRYSDLIFLLSICLFVYLIKHVQPIEKIISKISIIVLLVLCIDILTYLSYCAIKPERRYLGYLIQKIEHRHFSTHMHLCDPNFSEFRRGCIRSLLYEFALDVKGTTSLTKEQRELINEEIRKNKKVPLKDVCNIPKNIVFIIVESYMSFTSDIKVGTKEVTPFLNSLKKDPKVYYNGKMNENVTLGESSDGQFIYMTGLLPLRSIITISKVQNIELNGLPKMLGVNSRMIIPTMSSMWNQKEMCTQYSFNNLYTSSDYNMGEDNILNDEQVFQLAMQKDNNSQQPFFSVILTMSMHQPYTTQIDKTFPISDSNISDELACYLNACHYTDQQIKKYFDYLKRKELFEDCLIVITADHPVHSTDFNGVNKEIPLYIVNLPKEINDLMWKGKCNQIDLYSTLLDLYDIKSSWRGLGNSLLSPTYTPVINENKWDISEWIIRGNYFSEIR